MLLPHQKSDLPFEFPGNGCRSLKFLLGHSPVVWHGLKQEKHRLLPSDRVPRNFPHLLVLHTLSQQDGSNRLLRFDSLLKYQILTVFPSQGPMEFPSEFRWPAHQVSVLYHLHSVVNSKFSSRILDRNQRRQMK